MGGTVRAATVTWTGTGPDPFWSTPANWDTGALPTAADTARVEIRTQGTPCPIVAGDGAVAQVIETGWGTKPDELTIDGGTLTVGKGISVGRKNTATTIHMNGGVLTVGTNLTVGYWSPGTLVVNGGTITVGSQLQVSAKPAIPGNVDLRGGTITARQLVVNVDPNSLGTMDIGGGTLIVDGNNVSKIQGYIDNGWITAFYERGGGTLRLDYDVTHRDKTTLTAVHSLNPNPPYYSSVGLNVNRLQWTLPEPNQPGGTVTCDVYFGTDPDIEKNTKIVVREAVESAPVTLARDTVYYWALDVYDSSVSGVEPVMLSPIFTFNTMNTPPVVDAGEDAVTWLEDGVRTGNLDATVTDNGPCTVLWTVVSEPNDPDRADAVIADPDAGKTTVTFSAAGEYVLQVEASDGEYTSSETVTINVYDDGCGAAQSLPDYVPLLGDLNGDCKVDDADLTLLQQNWLQDNSLTDGWLTVD